MFMKNSFDLIKCSLASLNKSITNANACTPAHFRAPISREKCDKVSVSLSASSLHSQRFLIAVQQLVLMIKTLIWPRTEFFFSLTHYWWFGVRSNSNVSITVYVRRMSVTVNSKALEMDKNKFVCIIESECYIDKHCMGQAKCMAYIKAWAFVWNIG